jgi:Asp-tRNA(Asn)/Glu-tRNA(Gln) amidotransferase A subunit family amidase
VPVGAELLGREFSEPLLLSLAYAYEQAEKTRKSPHSTPPLSASEG